MKEKMNNKGFSLVELIIVIAIMAILVGVLAPQFIKYVEKSRLSTDMQNVEALRTAIEVYTAGAEGLSKPVDITVTPGTPGTAVISSTDTNVTAANLGISSLSQNLSSRSWTNTTVFEYSNTSYTWSVKTGTDTTATSNGVTYSMKSVFGL